MAGFVRQALSLGEEDGYVRVFVDESEWIMPTVRRLVGSWPSGYAAEIAAAIVRGARPPGFVTEPRRAIGPRTGGVALLVDVAVDAGDRRRALRVAEHVEVTRAEHLPQARREHA